MWPVLRRIHSSLRPFARPMVTIDARRSCNRTCRRNGDFVSCSSARVTPAVSRSARRSSAASYRSMGAPVVATNTRSVSPGLGVSARQASRALHTRKWGAHHHGGRRTPYFLAAFGSLVNRAVGGTTPRRVRPISMRSLYRSLPFRPFPALHTAFNRNVWRSWRDAPAVVLRISRPQGLLFAAPSKTWASCARRTTSAPVAAALHTRTATRRACLARWRTSSFSRVLRRRSSVDSQRATTFVHLSIRPGHSPPGSITMIAVVVISASLWVTV